MSCVLFGIDQLLATPTLVPGRLGLVTNDAARPARDPRTTSRVALQRAGFQVARLFSPEHGLGATAPDGAAVGDSFDAATGLPIVSLYGERMRPARENLANLDALLFDIPDIGARFYTYIWTLSNLLEVCAEAGLPLTVLDRPNPLGGKLAAAEGPVLDVERFDSFVGRAAIPIRHSLTVGELAQLWNSEWKLSAKLQIVPCAGWKRSMHWPETALPFIQTSPAIPSYDSALLYPGLCLFEATNLSVGRGTHFPFQAVGAPWLNAERVAQDFSLPEFVAEPIEFAPTQDRYARIVCQGVQLRVVDIEHARPVAAGLHLLAAVIRTHREEFRWANYPTAANPGGEGHFERLIGIAGIRKALEGHPPNLGDRINAWTAAPGWEVRTKRFLLYT